MNIGKLTVIACAAFVLPLAASAQSPDADYCKKLGSLARMYGANTGPVPQAITKCDSDAKAGIADLENHLQAEKIKLPPR